MSAADALFYRHGVTAVSLEAIAARAGVTRRTLYYHFASKEVLVAAYLKRRDVSGRALLEASSGPGDGAGRRVLAVFETLEQWFRTREFRGCALTNAVGEQVVIAGPVTLRHKRALLAWFVRTCASEAPESSAELGEQLLLLFDGALTSARTRRDPEVARHARSAAATLLRAHGIEV